MSDLVIDQISKRYGSVHALESVSLTIHPGIFGLLGPNGAGKATLMKILVTLLSPDSGSIQYGNITWGKRSEPVKKLLGYLPQHFGFYSHLTAREALSYVALMKGIEKADIPREVNRVLAQTNMVDHGEKQVGKLSGGMLRRLGIAQAIIASPPLLVIDEPTAGLDPEERIRFRNVLLEMGSNHIVLLSTHIVQDVEAICNQVAVIRSGRVLTCDTPFGIAQTAKGYVCQQCVSVEDFRVIAAHHEIISYVSTPEGILARYLDNACAAKDVVEPTLEDGYLFLTERNGRQPS